MQPSDSHERNLARIIDILIRVGVLILLLVSSFLILIPFVSILLWSTIIAVVLNPMYLRIKKTFRGRGKIAAILITVFFLALIIIPVVFLSGSIIDSFDSLSSVYKTGQLDIPPPGERAKDWPSIAKPILDAWQLASDNLGAAITKYQAELRSVVKAVLGAIAQTGIGILQLIVAIIIAGVLLSYGDELTAATRKIFMQLAERKGEGFMKLSELTIRNTVKGVLGVAVIQSLMAGVGMVVVGVPLAGLWFLACLILAILQIGVGPILIPVIVYVFATESTLTATLFLVWGIIVMISDNILKPFLLGHNAPAPTLVVFLGCIGGFIAYGFLGLFLGPVILALAYNLFLGWMNRPAASEDL